MDKDIRDFLDRVEQNRLYKEKRKRKEKLLEKQMNHQKRRSRRNAAHSDADLLLDEQIKEDNELRQLAKNGRDYGKRTKFKTKHRTPEEQKKYDWEHRPHFISVPMGGQNKRR